jgi:hypothetical protein
MVQNPLERRILEAESGEGHAVTVDMREGEPARGERLSGSWP